MTAIIAAITALVVIDLLLAASCVESNYVLCEWTASNETSGSCVCFTLPARVADGGGGRTRATVVASKIG